MSAAAVLAEARRLDVLLYLRGDRLGYDAPAGALSADLRARLSAHKSEIIAALRVEAVAVIDPAPICPPPPVVSAGAAGERWRCRNPYCLHPSRWWLSVYGVLNCRNCRPPAFPELVKAEGDLASAPVCNA